MRPWRLRLSAFAVLALACVSGTFAQDNAGQTDRLRHYAMDVFGPSVETAMEQARLHAVRSAVGEFYCSDEMFMARSLLNRYLQNYSERFVSSEKVLSRRESQGMVYVRASVVVDIDEIEKDLREKRFFYRPRHRPRIYVTLSETVDGTASTGSPISRGTIQEALKEIRIDPDGELVYTPPINAGTPNVDLFADPRMMVETLQYAQQRGVEVVITGRVELKLEEQRPIHFDSYTFYRARAELEIIRVDDGVVLGRGKYEAIAGHTDAEKAKEVAASRATTRILEKLIPPFTEEWERTMTDQVEFQVVVVGVSETEADVIQDRLKTRLGGVEVYRRSQFEDVVVFNLHYPPEKVRSNERMHVERALRDMVAPQLKITPIEGRKKIRAESVS